MTGGTVPRVSGVGPWYFPVKPPPTRQATPQAVGVPGDD
jgi:hypothetical protein